MHCLLVYFYLYSWIQLGKFAFNKFEQVSIIYQVNCLSILIKLFVHSLLIAELGVAYFFASYMPALGTIRYEILHSFYYAFDDDRLELVD